MSVFRDQRESIRDALAGAGILAFATVPDRFNPPAAFVGPGDPYITREGMNYGVEQVRHQVTLVTGAGVNDVRADELDKLILTALDALYSLEEFDVGDVGRPGQVSLTGQSYLAAAIDLTAQIHRE